ncbi:MAG: cysteine desulfurase family protein [Bacteroidia bacterium]
MHILHGALWTCGGGFAGSKLFGFGIKMPIFAGKSKHANIMTAKKVYLDNAASTPMLPSAFEAMKPYFLDYAGNPSSTHSHGRELRGAIEQSRRTIANCLGAQPSEIFFTSGGTEADNIAINGAVYACGVKRIISTQIEHHAVSHTIEALEKDGKVQVEWLSVSETGRIDHSELESTLKHSDAKTLVCIMHANNEIGTLNDLAGIGKMCEEHGALFHSDTVQTVGHESFDFANLPVHTAAASSHKFYGPKGVGFLYVKQGTGICSHMQGGSQERGMRPGTENVAAIAGMAAALQYCTNNLETKNAHLWSLKERMKAGLEQAIPGVQFNGETARGASLPTVLNVAPPCPEGDAMLIFSLDLQGVSASGGSACSSGAHQGSHVLHNLGYKDQRARNSVRFSFGIQNTQEDVDFAVKQLTDILVPSTAPNVASV